MNARAIALAVVRDVFPPPGSRTRERGAQEALDYRVRAAKAGARERAFATELAYGAIKMRRALDWYLDPMIGTRANTLPPAVREVLRLGIYELAYTRADVHATVFEFVNVAKRVGHRGVANLVNAVLRRFVREPTPAPRRESFEDFAEYLGTKHSLPTWLVRQWQTVFGERAEAVCAAVNEPARPALTVDVRTVSRDAAAQRLHDLGIVTAQSPLVAESLLVESGAGHIDAADGSPWWMQSESSAAVVAALDPQPGDRVLDVCSGRGNKALQIAGRIGALGTLTCVERDARKAALLAERAERSGTAAEIVVADATTIEVAESAYACVLVDAPCSGVGIVGRHPEARWKKQATDGERLAATQHALLDRMARCVRPGGAFVYAVCSTDPRETTEVMERFLSRHGFERRAFAPAFAASVTPSGDVLIPPGIGGRDGFFIAAVVRL